MKYNKLFSFALAIFILTTIFCSCAKDEGNLNVQVSPPDKSLIDLSTKTYEESQLAEIAEFRGSMTELNAKHPIECLRENHDYYRVSYLGKDRVAVLVFDRTGRKLMGNVYNLRKQKSDFVGLKNGQTLDDVKKIDPDGEYSFLYTGRNDSPKESSHYTKDGYLITIKYDVTNNIIGIDEELI